MAVAAMALLADCAANTVHRSGPTATRAFGE
jgi:hypothetical protein